MALEKIVKLMLRFSAVATASLAFSCSSCDKEKLGPLSYCEITSNYAKTEICNNNFDDNCNQFYDEGCDDDNDGYCREGQEIAYSITSTPTVCVKTFQYCTEEPCENARYDCDDANPNINPGMTELCNAIDDNCNRKTDESFPEYNQKCWDGIGPEPIFGGSSICVQGRYFSCLNGRKMCSDYSGPHEEVCNSLDDDCDGTINNEGVLTEARPCYYDNNGNNLPLDHPSIYPEQQGICMKGVELCINGKVGGDGICHGSSLPQPEVCDCFDNNCRDGVDEGLHTTLLLQIGVAVDISGSMQNIIQSIRQQYSNIETIACSEDVILISTISIGGVNASGEWILGPVLKRSLVSVQEFRNGFYIDIPNANGPGSEANLNTIAYSACTLLDVPPQNPHPLCELIQPYNSLNDPHRPVFTPGAKHVLFVLSDEYAQWVNPSYQQYPNFPILNQQQVAELASAAGLEVIIFTNPIYNTLELNPYESQPLQGYGYFVQMGIGTIIDITTPDLTNVLEQLIFNFYCTKNN